MKRRLLAFVVVACLVAPALAAAPLPGGSYVSPTAAFAKTCSASYTHAVIGGSQKCLRRGQYCARALDRQYHRYGFHCHNRDARGSYHLT